MNTDRDTVCTAIEELLTRCAQLRCLPLLAPTQPLCGSPDAPSTSMCSVGQQLSDLIDGETGVRDTFTALWMSAGQRLAPVLTHSAVVEECARAAERNPSHAQVHRSSSVAERIPSCRPLIPHPTGLTVVEQQEMFTVAPAMAVRERCQHWQEGVREVEHLLVDLLRMEEDLEKNPERDVYQALRQWEDDIRDVVEWMTYVGQRLERYHRQSAVAEEELTTLAAQRSEAKAHKSFAHVEFPEFTFTRRADLVVERYNDVLIVMDMSRDEEPASNRDAEPPISAHSPPEMIPGITSSFSSAVPPLSSFKPPVPAAPPQRPSTYRERKKRTLDLTKKSSPNNTILRTDDNGIICGVIRHPSEPLFGTNR